MCERCSDRLDVPPPVLQEAGNQLRETRVHPDADASQRVLFDGVQERRFADGFGEVSRAAGFEALLDLLWQRVSGQCQDRNRPGAVLAFPLTDPACGGGTGHDRHLDINAYTLVTPGAGP